MTALRLASYNVDEKASTAIIQVVVGQKNVEAKANVSAVAEDKATHAFFGGIPVWALMLSAVLIVIVAIVMYIGAVVNAHYKHQHVCKKLD